MSGGIRILSGGVGGAGSRGVAPGLRGQVVEFRLRVPQSLGFAAEDAFRGAFDSLAEFGDIGAGGAFGSGGLRKKAAIDQLGADVQKVAGVHLAGAAHRVIELLRQKRLGVFRLFGDVFHAGDEVGQRALLAGDLLNELLTLRGVVQGLLLGMSERFEAAPDFALLAVQVARLAAQLAHLVGELAGGLAAHVLAQVLQSLLRARAGGQGLGNGFVADFLGGALGVGAGLLQLLACF